MPNELSDKEAQALFNGASKAIRENDFDKLNSLMEDPIKVEETPLVEKEPDPEPVVQPEVTPIAEKVPEKVEEKKEEVPPEIKAEPVVEQETKKPTELEELRQRLDRLAAENHDLRSQAGRVPAVQRRISELDKKLEELAKAKSTPSDQSTDDVSELLKGVRETDPELADAVAAAINKATSGAREAAATKEEDTLRLLRRTEYDTYVQTETDRLLTMYPNAKEVFASPHWNEWKTSQSKGIVNLANSDTAEDVAYAFQKYAQDMAVKYPQEVKKVETEQVPPTTDTNTDKAAQIEAERKRKKESAVTIGSPNAAGKIESPSDEAALFAKFTEEIRKKRLGS